MPYFSRSGNGQHAKVNISKTIACSANRRWSRTTALLLCANLASIGGCYVDPPLVTREGEIRGGHPKIHALLKLIKERRAEVTLERAVIMNGAWYSASIQPTPQAVLVVGAFPAKDNAPAVEYKVLCSPETIDSARVASLTEVLFVQQGQPTCTILVLEWKEDSWVTTSTTSVGFVPAGTIQKSTSQPTARGDQEASATYRWDPDQCRWSQTHLKD